MTVLAPAGRWGVRPRVEPPPAAEMIVAGHRTPPLPAGADETIAGVLAEAGRALAAR